MQAPEKNERQNVSEYVAGLIVLLEEEGFTVKAKGNKLIISKNGKAYFLQVPEPELFQRPLDR